MRRRTSHASGFLITPRRRVILHGAGPPGQGAAPADCRTQRRRICQRPRPGLRWISAFSGREMKSCQRHCGIQSPLRPRRYSSASCTPFTSMTLTWTSRPGPTIWTAPVMRGRSFSASPHGTTRRSPPAARPGGLWQLTSMIFSASCLRTGQTGGSPWSLLRTRAAAISLPGNQTCSSRAGIPVTSLSWRLIRRSSATA